MEFIVPKTANVAEIFLKTSGHEMDTPRKRFMPKDWILIAHKDLETHLKVEA